MKLRFCNTSRLIHFVTLLILASPSTGYSQQDAQDEQDEQEQSKQEEPKKVLHNVIEEIVVTATKQESSAQDTPIAISAFNAENLAESRIVSAVDVQLSAPNVLHTSTNFGTSNFTIRGVGNNALAGSADAGVGIHFNHMYLNFSHLSQMEYFDVERVEVLRGPQGTLYGRNTTGGVLNLITRKPEAELGGFINVEGGDYNTRKIKGAFNFPITDRLFQRFSIFSLARDGFTENLYTGNDIDGRDMYAVRSSTLFEINDTTDISMVINYFREDSTRARLGKPLCTKDPTGILGCLPESLGFETPHGAATVDSALAGEIFLLPKVDDQVIDPYADSVNPTDLRKTFIDFEPINKIKDLIVLIELNHDFSDLTLTSSIGYQDNYDFSLADQDQAVPSVAYNSPVTFNSLAPEIGGTVVDRAVVIDEAEASSKQYSLEFRLSSQYNGRYNFNLGFYALDYEIGGGYKLYSSAISYYGALVSLPDESARLFVEAPLYGVKTWAIFNENYYELNDNTRVTFGWRYTYESKEQDSRTIFANFADALDDPYAHQEYDANELTGKLGIDYALDLSFTDETLVYGNISRGYKGGGFNPPAVASAGVSDVYDPEFNNAVELGLKSTLFDRRLQANFAYFHYDYEGMQIAKIVEQTAINENADTMIQGFEIEILAQPFNNLVIDFNVAWLETEIENFQSIDVSDPAQNGSGTEGVQAEFGSNCLVDFVRVGGRPTCANPGVEKNLSGNALPYSPEASYKLGVVYFQQLDNGGEIGYRIDYYWQNEYMAQVYNSVKDKIDAWSITNLHVFFTPPSETWNLSLYVKNLQDDDNITGQFVGDPISGLSRNVFLLEPRTMGLSYSYYYR